MKDYLQLKFKRALDSLNFDFFHRSKSLIDMFEIKSSEYQNPSGFSNKSASLIPSKVAMPNLTVGLLLLIALIGFKQNVNAQTTLAPGDVALLGINASTTDQFYWTITKPITSGTVIYFTDNGYTSTTAGRTGEGFVSFTAAANYPAGTVFTWTNGAAVSSEYASLVGGTANAPTNFSFNASGDQFFIYQSSTALNSTNAPTTWAATNQTGLTILYGINYGAALATTGSGAAGTTYQPSTSILASASFVNFPGTTANNLYYTTNGSAATAVSLFQSASGLYSELTNTTRFVTSSALLTFPLRYIFAIGSLSAVNTTYGSASPTPTSFQVTARGLTNNIALAALSPFEYATTVNGTYSNTLTLTQSGGSINTSVFVRLAATASVVGSPYSGNIGFSSTGAQSFNVATVSSSVSAATVTITPTAGQSKVVSAADPIFTYTASPSVTVTGSLTRIPGESIGTYPYALGTLSAGSNYTLSLNNTLFSITAPSALNITASAGTGGSISPSGGVSVTNGGNQTFNITANSCFSISDVLVDGLSVGAVTTYNFSNVTADHTISATFAQNTNTITASAGSGGSISPNGITTVNCGTNSTTYTITANSGFAISDVLVNGVSQGAISSYTFTNVSSNQNISASFAVVNPTVALSVNGNSGTEAATTVITVTATASSAVSSNQTISVGVSGANITNGDYSLSNTTITILNGQTTGSVTFTVVNDVLVEGPETATLTISNPSSGITLGSPISQSISITDNDSATTIDLSTYVRVGRYDLPEPTRTAHPTNSLLAQEVSAVTYNWDTNTLFVVGDGSTSIVQVSKTGQLIDSMTLAQGSSPQGTEFYDTEGLTYIGNGQFVMSEERDRQVVKFTYVAGTTLTRSATQTVKLGTFVNNIGTEGLSFDPITNGYIVAKEITPIGIFQTGIDFAAGTATNGSPTTVDSVNLFDPSLLGVSDVADVFALSNLPSLNGQALYSNLLVLSQEAAKVVNISRSGVIANSLTIVSDAGNPLDVASQQHEGLTMDRDGILYVVSENGGGSIDYPQLWVYAPSTAQNQAPTAVALTNTVNSILENTATTPAVKVADIAVTDDGLGTNTLSLSGADASSFEITGSSLYIKPGTVLDYETKTSYSVTINVNDTTVGTSPDASVNYVLNITDVLVETTPTVSVSISEVAPWSSGTTSVAADWFEVTNNGATALNITGWKVDDNSNSFSAALPLTGITSIAPGESVIFLETSSTNAATIIANFKSTWFGANIPASLQVGSYTGGGIGLSTGGDAVNLFDASGIVKANVTFGVATTNYTFNNAAGLNNSAITTLSQIGVNDAFAAVNDTNQIGSPGTVGRLFISEVAPWSSGNSPVAADWFEITNTKAVAVDITGWKIDDNSQSPAAAVALNGITSINPGESVIFIETNDLPGKTTAFLNNWFGTNPSSGLRIGNYTGTGVGLGSGGDQVNLYNGVSSTPVASVLFGNSPTVAPYTTFDNAAGINVITTPITLFSSVGVNGAFIAANSTSEIGSPGTIKTAPCPTITAAATPATATVCVGSTTTVLVTVSGGTLPFTVTGSPLTVGAGTYNYTVTDAKGCIATTSLTINTTDLLALSAAGTISCNGGTTIITVSASGGTAPYLGTGTFTVSAGAYSYTVTDANGCTSITSGTISQPTQLVASALAGTISCNGGTTTVTVSATAGTAPYIGTGTFTVSAGAYSFTVTDANGCTSVTSGTVTQPTQLVASSIAGTTNCTSSTTTVNVTATGGTAPYTGTGTFTVGAGAYSYTVMDANGCTAITSGTVVSIADTTPPTIYFQPTALSTGVTGPSTTQTPYVLSQSAGGKFTSLLSVNDVAGSYRMCGIPDGLGAFDNNNGTFTLLMNHEIVNTLGITRAHGSKGAFVSKWIINKSTLAVQSGSDLMQNVYLWNPTTSSYSLAGAGAAAFSRFCSADLPAVSAFYNSATGLGTQERIFMNGEESGAEGRALGHIVTGPSAGNSYELPYLGKFAFENSVASPFSGNKTVVGSMDDGSGGQVYFYIGTKTNTGTDIDKAGLNNGKLYGVKVTGLTAEVSGSIPAANTPFTLSDLGFVQNKTGAQLETLSAGTTTTFLRPEDGAFDPSNPNDFYFATTNAFASPSRLWRLRFNDITNPETGGTITAVLDGSEGQKMFDNLTIDKFGHIILLEDVGGNNHNGKIWQYTIATDNLKLVGKHDPARFGDLVGSTVTAPTAPFSNDEETSGIIDVSDILGAGKFLLVDQAHYSAGLANQTEVVEGGQLLQFFNPESIGTTVNAAPAEITGCSSTTINLGTPVTADNCSVVSVTNNAPATFPVGITTVTWTVTDASGNTATATQTVTNVNALTWYQDLDGDGYGSTVSQVTCTNLAPAYSLVGGDCDDTNTAINPSRIEICYNNLDDNCSGALSEGCAPVIVNMTPSYNNTTLASLSTSIPAVAYTYAPYSNLKYRFSITNVTSGAPAVEIIQTSRYVTIPASLHLYGASYDIKVSAVINDEVVAYAGNTIRVTGPTVQLITLSAASCGATIASLTSNISANAGLNATGYTFRIRLNDSNPTPTYAYSQSPTRFVSANSFTGFPLQYGMSYKIAVQYSFTDPLTSSTVLSGYGAECTLNTGAIPLIGLTSPICGSRVASLNANITASAASFATGYQFRIRSIGSSNYYTTNVSTSRFSSLVAFQGITLAYNTPYLISVQYSIFDGASTVWSGYGDECQITTPVFPVTSLVPSQCGLPGRTSLTQTLNITPYPGFPNYKVKLEISNGESLIVVQEREISYSYFKLSDFSLAQPDTRYYISVAIKLNGVYGDYSSACEIYTAALAKMATVEPFKAIAHPNPYASNFSISLTTTSEDVVGITVYDMLGRLIDKQEVRPSDLSEMQIGSQYPTGVYNIVITQGEEEKTLRVIKR